MVLVGSVLFLIFLRFSTCCSRLYSQEYSIQLGTIDNNHWWNYIRLLSYAITSRWQAHHKALTQTLQISITIYAVEERTYGNAVLLHCNIIFYVCMYMMHIIQEGSLAFYELPWFEVAGINYHFRRQNRTFSCWRRRCFALIMAF